MKILRRCLAFTRCLDQTGLDRLIEADSLPQFQSLLMGYGEREGTAQFCYHLHIAFLTVVEGKDMVLRAEQDGEAFGGSACPELFGFETVEHGVRHFQQLHQLRDGYLLRHARLVAVARRVFGQRLLQLVGDAQVVHDQAAGLVAEDAVHAGNRLHQPRTFHRLVDIHGVQAGHIEAGQPHIAHDDQLQRVVGIFEPFGNRLPTRLVADMGLEVQLIGGDAGHDDLEAALTVVVAVPVRAQGDDLSIEVGADTATHADDHGLALHGRLPRLEVLDNVSGNQSNTFRRADHRLHLRPFTLESLLDRDFLTLGHLLELRVDVGSLVRREFQLREPSLVEDPHRRAVLHRAGDVVDLVRDRHPVHKEAVKTSVVLQQGRVVGTGQLAEGFFKRIGRQTRVQATQRGAQATHKHHVRIGEAFRSRFSRRNVGTMQNMVAQLLEPA